MGKSHDRLAPRISRVGGLPPSIWWYSTGKLVLRIWTESNRSPIVTLQTRLSDLMQEGGLTQAGLSEKTGIDRADLSRLLRSGEPRFTVRTILKLARGLGVTPATMLVGRHPIAP
jgi:DNA-binding Xre family transcriptional regulator